MGGSRIARRRGRQPSRRGLQHTKLPDFPKKLHEIKKILIRGGGGGGGGDPPLQQMQQVHAKEILHNQTN